ncbi:MAG: hypothetical protein EA365_13795 [Gloeocapsa sp. DLM2.Bin57]|nr:MAG: hypothetical protein EA365_13795 [Gloeocapsa sp. DLM2.Bin57]
MLQDAQSIRYYQKLTDTLVDFRHRGYRFDELKMYSEGYLAALRYTNVLESHLINRLEAEIFRFLQDPSNFELPLPQPEIEY